MKPQLRVVDSEQPHNLDIARQRIAEFRLDREKGQGLPVTNKHDVHGAPLLDRDAVLKASEPRYAPNISQPRRQRRWWPWRRL